MKTLLREHRVKTGKNRGSRRPALDGWRIGGTRIVLSVRLSQQSECVAVIWTAETCRVLMFAQPPTRMCLRSRAKSRSKRSEEETNIQSKCLPWVMIPACLAAQKLRNTHSCEISKYMFLEGT